MNRRSTLLGLSVLALAPAVSAQTVAPLVSEGDTVIGVGAIVTFLPPFVDLTDGRMWTLVADTDFSTVTEDVVMLRNGFVTLREGASMILPAGAKLASFVSVDLANNGNLGMILTTRSPTSTSAYWNLIRVADVDTPIDSPELGPNSKWIKFEVLKLNSANQMYVLGEINNTAVPQTREDALIRYDLDGLGNVLATDVLLTRDQQNDTLGTTVLGLATSLAEHVFAVNKHGDYITFVSGFGGIEVVMINADTIVAQELSPSSVGVPWRGLDLTKVSINDFGDYVLTGSLSGDTNSYLIEKNGQKFARSGDVIPTYSNAPLAAGSAGPVYIANTGDVFWRAETSSGEPAFMRNMEPIVKGGTTVLDGNLVLSVPPNEHSFAISPNGRFLLGRIDSLQTVGESSFLVDFGLVVNYPGCHGNEGKLTKVQGEARLGQTLQLAMDEGQEPGVISLLSFATRPRVLGSDCGVVTAAGELLISPAHRFANKILNPWNGNPVATNVAIPNTPALFDLKVWAQGFFRDVNGSSGEPTRMTNGLLIELGAP